MIRRLLYRIYTGWHRLLPPKVTLGVRGLVIDDKGYVCLVRHTYRDGWFLPGGGVKPQESLIEAMSRELREETGIELSERPKRVLGVYSSFAEHKSDHVVVYVLDDWRRGEQRSAEIAEVRFCPPGELPEGTSAATERRIKEWITGVPPGSRW